MGTGPNPPNRPPDAVNVVRRIVYDGASLLETIMAMNSGDEDVVIGLTDIINLALDYAFEDINNSEFNFELVAVWCDENGNDEDAVVYDSSGCPIEWVVHNESKS